MKMLRSIWSERELILELSRRELFQVHSGHMLGGFWVFVSPLLTLLVYFLVFRFVFPHRFPGTGSAEAYLLAGLVQWITTAEVLSRACTVIKSNAGLVKQVNFPIETLVAQTVFTSIFVQIVMTIGLFIILLLSGAISMSSVALWLIALAIQTVFLLGAALLIASVTPFLPDVTELVSILTRLGLFVAPILFPADQFGSAVEAAFYVNPFSYFAWIHQDAIFYGAFENAAHWFGAGVLAGGAYFAGQAIFRAMCPAFNDVL